MIILENYFLETIGIPSFLIYNLYSILLIGRVVYKNIASLKICLLRKYIFNYKSIPKVEYSF